jgi:hypothetical protein
MWCWWSRTNFPECWPVQGLKENMVEVLKFSNAPLLLPNWLLRATAENMLDEAFPLYEILDGSLYYPACAFDGGPVKYLGKRFHSFVFTDYIYGRKHFLEELSQKPFKKYQVVGTRSVLLEELAPNGWAQPSLTKLESEQVDRHAAHKADKLFCEWVILERDADAKSNHGPDRFSLLYLNEEGAKAYYSLYVGNTIRAGAIAVIQPGHSFGLNWTDFTDPLAVLARVVMANPVGAPELYLSGGMGARKYLPDPWPKYTNQLGWYPYGAIGSVGIWERLQ